MIFLGSRGVVLATTDVGSPNRDQTRMKARTEIEKDYCTLHRRQAFLKGALGLAAAICTSHTHTEAHAQDTSGVAGYESECRIATDPEFVTVTDTAFIEFGLCPSGVKSDRRLGDKSILCGEPALLGTVLIGLYGRAAPGTVENFKTLMTSGALNGTCISKVLPGQWIVAGQQGPHRSGLLEAPPAVTANPDTLSATAFCLRHLRPGTVSLNLSQNEDEDYLRATRDYRNLSFLITTGPGPAPILDDENIVFGVVERGLDVVGAISRVPTFQPSGNLRAFNDLAKLIGDERANKTRAKWGKPLQAIVITNSGLLVS